MRTQNSKDRPPENGILDKLSNDTCDRLREDLQLVEMEAGKVLYESGAKQHQMYFPRSGIVSLLYVMENGDASEIAMAGREGMVGSAVLVDSHSTPASAIVLVPGQAYSLKADMVEREFRRGGEFQFMVLRYTQVLIAQMSQSAVCNKHHTLERQLCRWLLQCLDRTESNELKVTQESIAGKLGVRREGITEAAGRLQESGLISYTRGKITLLDRQGLEDGSCECYAVVKNEYERLLTPM